MDYYPKIATIPQDVYNRTLWLIRGYDRLKEEAEDLVEQTPRNDGLPKGNAIGDPTAEAAARREKITAEIGYIEGALLTIPEEYRAVILENVARKTPLSRIPAADFAAASTWSKYRMVFIVGVARRAVYV